MEELLDDNFEKRNKINRDKVSFILSIVMLIGGVIFIKFTTNLGAKANLYILAISSFLIQIIFVIIGSILNLVTNFFKRENQDKLISKPFLEKSVIKGFIFWLLMIIVVVLDKLLLSIE